MFVQYAGASKGASASLDVSYSGGQTLSVPLTSTLANPVPMGSAARWIVPVLLLGLGIRRARTR